MRLSLGTVCECERKHNNTVPCVLQEDHALRTLLNVSRDEHNSHNTHLGGVKVLDNSNTAAPLQSQPFDGHH